ncbi:hypothetical protein D3C86_2170320 [compost metagenome]
MVGKMETMAIATTSVILRWNMGCEMYQDMPLTPKNTRASPVATSTMADAA